MKKTIIALCFLAGVAIGTEDSLLVSTLTASVANITTSANVSDLDISGWSLSNTTTGVTLTSMSGGAAFADALRPNINVGNDNSWTLSFTISNESEADYTLSSITLNAFTFNSAGNGQFNKTFRKFLFAVYEETNTANRNLLYQDETPRNLSGPAENDKADTINSDPHVLTFDFSEELTLAAKSSTTLSLVVSDGTPGVADTGCFLGATQMSIAGQVVPEPTTAALSLLALAGLAARRRRK